MPLFGFFLILISLLYPFLPSSCIHHSPAVHHIQDEPNQKGKILCPISSRSGIQAPSSFDSIPHGCSNLTRTVVIPKTKEEDITWTRDIARHGWNLIFYHVEGHIHEPEMLVESNGEDGQGKIEHRITPLNKGHEVIVSLIYYSLDFLFHCSSIPALNLKTRLTLPT